MPTGIKGSYKTYSCIQCAAIKRHRASSTNKFCSNTCQATYKWEQETIPKIERGECTSNSVTPLKKYLVEKFGETCDECGMPAIWNGKKLTLQLDHIDGNSDNNFPSNLRLLCPNCHSQTDTFGSTGYGSKQKKNTLRNTYLREYKSP